MPDSGVPSGQIIRAHRQRAGLSTADYARLLGVKRGTIENWENERNTPRAQHLLRLNQLLAQPPEQLARPAPHPAPALEHLGMRTCADLIVTTGNRVWLLEIKSTSCAGVDAFQRQVSNALRRDGLRVYRELPADGENDEPPGILLSDP